MSNNNNADHSIYNKMLNKPENFEESEINCFPQPYNKEATPYWNTNFDEDIIIACSKGVGQYLGVCKAIFIGDVSVGKTSLVNKFCHKTYDMNCYKATIGVNFEVETFKILSTPFKLQIFDTAGQERFKCIAHFYYRNAQVIVVVFDMTNLQTLGNATKWLQDALIVNSTSDYHLFLVGTKSDLLPDNIFQEIEKIITLEAKRIDAELWIVSANTGDNINALFRRIASLAFNSAVRRVIEPLSPSQIQKVASRIQLSSTKKIDRKRRNCSGCS